jgi:hypothetical protein
VRRLAALVLVVVLAAGCGSDGADDSDADGPATTATAVAELGVVDPVTDNYKACFNTDPTAFEPRTWLSVSGVVAGDVTYGLPAGTPSSVDTAAADGLALVGDDGTSATLVADVGPAEVAANGGLFRVEAVGRFGLLVPIRSREALADDSLVATLTLAAESGPIAEVEARYDPDATLADVGPGSPELGGPAGRWTIGGTPTVTDVERAPYTC